MLAELDNLPLLQERLRRQTCQDFTLYLCVNNVEGGYGFEENQCCLKLLAEVRDLPLVVIDRSSPGLGWSGKRRGVGYARKELFDRILQECDDNELLVSLDADTDFDSRYLEALLHTFNSHPRHQAFSVPYYHPLSGCDDLDRAMLRYECYMRHYHLGLLRIGSPYAFTALGSAIVCPAWAYRRVGGITPLMGGEDFYLMQKFAKTGQILQRFDAPYDALYVRPQGRTSARVPFGTGPAIARGLDAMDESYPFYAPEGFDAVKATTDLFPALYDADIETPLSPFLRQQLATDQLWEPLRRNFKTRDRFVHACHERLDGLRILQYLKNSPACRLSLDALPVDFRHDPITTLAAWRDALLRQERDEYKIMNTE